MFAETGNLSSMVGSSKELFDRVKPIILTFSDPQKIFHCGPAGAGLAAKIINNYIASVSYVGLCEGINTGARYGLDLKILTGAFWLLLLVYCSTSSCNWSSADFAFRCH